MATPMEDGSSERFYDAWLAQQEDFIEQLQFFTNTSVQDKFLQPLIGMVLHHHRQFIQARRAAARLDVLAVLSPAWLTPFERSITWVAGWRPRSLLRVARTALAGSLTDDQLRRIDQLRAEAVEREDVLSGRTQALQDAVLSRRMVALARTDGRIRNGEHDHVSARVDAELESVCAGLERLLDCTDQVRFATLTSVVKMLTPAQAAEFLAAAGLWMVQLRRWGKIHLQRNNGVGSVNAPH